MKKYIYAAAVALIFSGTLIAQGKPEKQAQEKAKMAKEKSIEQKNQTKDKAEKEVQKGKDNIKEKVKENQGKGNAYGTDKNGLSGKEFGQQRAEEARMKSRKELEISVEDGQRKIKNAREKIKKSTDELERKHRERSITNEEYERRKRTIEEASKEVNNSKNK